MVEKGMPGFTIGKVEDKMGIRCVPVVEIHFDNCRVPAKNLLGETPGCGFKHAMMTLDQARPGVAAQARRPGAGRARVRRWSTRGTASSSAAPISSFQMIQAMLADMATKVEAARNLVYVAAMAVDSGAPNVSKLSAMCKLFATDVAMEVTTDAVQIFGGYGYMRDYPIEKYMRDAKITQIYEGTNQVQRHGRRPRARQGGASPQAPARLHSQGDPDGVNDPETLERLAAPSRRSTVAAGVNHRTRAPGLSRYRRGAEEMEATMAQHRDAQGRR